MSEKQQKDMNEQSEVEVNTLQGKMGRDTMPKISEDQFEVVMDSDSEAPYLVEKNEKGEVIAERDLSNEFMSYLLLVYGNKVSEVEITTEDDTEDIVISIAPKQHIKNIIASLENYLDEK